jgi:crotonobetainyl-CoA:carnitine CoA-transferase CaiB-like acyl-CoA transferase
MSRHKLAVGKLRSVADVCDTDWAREREVVVEVTDRGDGFIRIPNAPWRFQGSTIRTGGEPRYRGEDNRAVLHELLGLDDAELDRLQADGVLTDRIPKRG